MLLRIHAHQSLAQWLNVLLPVAQRRRDNMHDIQPVEQVIAERAPLNGILKVGIRQCNQTRVNFDRLASTEPFELAILDHAQQFRLRIHRQVRDLIQHQRAAMRGFQAARLSFGRSGERASLVAK